MIHFGDIKQLNGAELPIVDCVIGGSPCQDLSLAGKRAGLSGARSGLFIEQIRIVKEMRQRCIDLGFDAIKPRFMIWENVPGAFSSNKGEDFRVVIEEIIKIVCPEAPPVHTPEKGWSKAGSIVGNGWSIAWRTHDAQFWGVPQRRKRISLVADFGSESAYEILFERKSRARDIAESRAEKKEPADQIGNNPKENSGSCLTPWDVQSKQIYSKNGVFGTLYAGNSGGERTVFITDARGNGDGCICPTLTGDHENRITDYTAIVTYSEQSHGEYKENDVASTMSARQYKSATDLVATDVIRRLTPLECERLQGFPDGWTDIGDWVDENGKLHKLCDSHRYKALGNSIALPFWDWLIERVSKIYDYNATMGSLFDGIGGFPLCWNRYNGDDSTLWCSEIEPFCIAVTKKRFG